VLVIESGATPYIYVPLTTPLADPTGLLVDLALVAQDTTPGSADWQPATWRSPTVGADEEVALQRSTVLWPDGEYMAFVRVHAAPELLILRAGRVRIGDTRGTVA